MMLLSKVRSRFGSDTASFNLTPVIDIVFQLIIFFALVCKFIEAENFPVAVPDSCKFAQKQEQVETGAITVTVMKTAGDNVGFAVGSEKILVSDYETIPQKLAQLINTRMQNIPSGERLVTLRIDKNIDFGRAQYALAGIAESLAAEIRLAAFKDKRGGE
jgi:biopolymer transport protein ExbD